MLADTANLIVNLSLKGNFAQGIGRVSRDLNKFDARLNKSESRAYRFGQQLGTGIRRSAALAAGGLAFLALNVQQGLDSLVKLESQTEATNAAIKSTGGVAGITADAVRKMAEEFESVNALFSDEIIQSAENMLLAFTNIRKRAFKPALQAVLDLNAGLGQGPDSLTATAKLLGIALNDPTKGLTRLSRAGVQFTAAQIKRIKLLQKEGKLYEAQAIILKEVEKRFGGRGAAFGGETARKVAKFKDAIEDLQRTLAVGLLPVVSNVADALSKLLSDPQVQADVARFGKDLAGIFTKERIGDAAKTIGDVVGAITRAMPTIASGLGAAATVIGTVIDAFKKLPPEVQQLAVGAFVANKLTGGLVTNLVGGIAGLFKNFVAAGVNIEAATVIVNGGIGGPGGVPGGGKPGEPTKPGGFGPAIGAGIIISEADLKNAADIVRRKINAGLTEGGAAFAGKLADDLGTQSLQRHFGGKQADDLSWAKLEPKVQLTNDQLAAIKEQQTLTVTTTSAEAIATRARITGSSDAAASRITSTTSSSADRIIGAIWAARPIVNVTNVTKTTTIQNRYGPGNGSYGGGH